MRLAITIGREVGSSGYNVVGPIHSRAGSCDRCVSVRRTIRIVFHDGLWHGEVGRCETEGETLCGKGVDPRAISIFRSQRFAD